MLASAVPAQGHLRALIAGPAPDMERYARDMDRSLIWMRQNDDSAYHLLREQLTKATMRRDTLRTAWMNYYLGGILMWRSDHPGALEHYAQARDLFRSMRGTRHRPLQLWNWRRCRGEPTYHGRNRHAKGRCVKVSACATPPSRSWR
ncbi:MAG: hypothetical protein IPI07_11435 [Flavobacteriales bacterium]|nr:hypothetical protein [Flavobacteriales bacterium]